MGGFGSGREPYATTPTVEACTPLNINELLDAIRAGQENRDEVDGNRVVEGTIEIGADEMRIAICSTSIGETDTDGVGWEVCLSYSVQQGDEVVDQIEDTLPLTFTDREVCGERPRWRCPGCADRVEILYSPPRRKRFRCRDCYDLVYKSSRKSGNDRETARLRFKRAYEELTDERWDGEWWVIPDRPKGMHRSTYEELATRMRKAHDEKEEAYFRELRKMHARAQR